MTRNRILDTILIVLFLLSLGLAVSVFRTRRAVNHQAAAIRNAVLIAQEDGVVAGSASCAADVYLFKTAKAYEVCLDAIDQDPVVSTRSRAVLDGIEEMNNAQKVYAYCDDNVDWLTRIDYAACYTAGSILDE